MTDHRGHRDTGRAAADGVALGKGEGRLLAHGCGVHTGREEGSLQLRPELLLLHKLAHRSGAALLDEVCVLAVRDLDQMAKRGAVAAPLAAEAWLLGPRAGGFAEGLAKELRLAAIDERQGQRGLGLVAVGNVGDSHDGKRDGSALFVTMLEALNEWSDDFCQTCHLTAIAERREKDVTSRLAGIERPLVRHALKIRQDAAGCTCSMAVSVLVSAFETVTRRKIRLPWSKTALHQAWRSAFEHLE